MKSKALRTALYLLLFILLSGFNSTQTELLNKIENFINSYSEKYVLNENKSNFSYKLETKTNYTFSKNFTLKKNDPFKNKYNQVVYPLINISIYKYKNRKDCNKAIDTLLSCFPNDCWNLVKGENLKGIHMVPSIVILNNTEILTCKIKCEHENDEWKRIKEYFTRVFAEDSSDIIITGCGGPLKWSKY